MTRRVAFCAAVFFVAALLPVSAVSASVTVDSSETYEMFLAPVQIDGPPGFQSPNEGVSWGLDRIDQRMPISYDVNDRSYSYASDSTGAGVKVFVADTGVQADHPDLVGRVQPGWSYRNSPDALDAYRGSYSNCSDTYLQDGLTYERQIASTYKFDNRVSPYTSNDDGTTDNQYHGTHVASLIAGQLTGVAKDATIIPVRVFDSCGRGNDVMLIEGLRWILDTQHQPGDKTIVNLSLMFNQRISSIDAVISEMIASGIIVVVAAGNISVGQNFRDSCAISPAGSDNKVITVAASRWYDDETSFSFGGSCVDIFAPGYFNVGAWSYKKPAGGVVQPNSFLELPGTSMAAPHVAGALARYLQNVETMATNAAVSDNAMTWLKTNATCNAVSYARTGVTQTPNRILTIGADPIAPCAPSTATATAGDEAATVTWSEPAAFNGATPTYTATATPGGAQCVTTALSCTLTGLAGNTQHTISVVASNSAGSSAPVTATVTPRAIPAMNNLQLITGNAALTAQWGITTTTATTFTATVSPGGQQCVTTSTSCTITGLVNNQPYTVTLTGTNSLGSTTLTGTATPNGAPLVPSAVRTTAGNGRATFQWIEIADSVGVSYQLSSRDGRHTCVTTGTSCTIRNLPNGKARTLYLRTSTTAGGNSLGETAIKVWAGFNVRRTEVRRSTRTALTSLVTPVSKGRRSWSVSSPCRISAGRLVAPRRATSCFLTLKVGKTRTMSATSIRMKVVVR